MIESRAWCPLQPVILRFTQNDGEGTRPGAAHGVYIATPSVYATLRPE